MPNVLERDTPPYRDARHGVRPAEYDEKMT
jgi:hypothetical protein